MRKQYDIMIVGYPGQQAAIVAKFLTRKPIVVDALVPLHESLVYSRGLLKRLSIRGVYYWLLEWFSLILAHRIIVDTNAHREYFSRSFHLNPNKFRRIFIGSDDDVFCPKQVGTSEFIVHFHGALSPLQGVDYIVRAAKILEREKIIFQIIGDGQSSDSIRQLVRDLDVRNVRLLGHIPYEQLMNYISRASISLGLFGKASQAQRAIPNKVYEALAARSPIITSRTPGAQELLTDKKDVLFCEAGSAEDLARAILEIRNNGKMREDIARNGYDLFKSRLTPVFVGRDLVDVLQELMT